VIVDCYRRLHRVSVLPEKLADLVPLQLDAATNKKVTPDSPDPPGDSGQAVRPKGGYG
jgi:hypothetical protein